MPGGGEPAQGIKIRTEATFALPHFCFLIKQITPTSARAARAASKRVAELFFNLYL